VVLDFWVVVALGQVALLATVAAGICAWRWRAAARRARALDARFDETEKALADGKKLLADAKGGKYWQPELEARIAGVPADDDYAEIRRRVLTHELNGEPLDLADCIAAPTDVSALTELESLKAELAALKATPAPEATPHSERERELKSLVTQFTHDSREMLSCIQSLEAENKDLRAQVATSRTAA
jgi:hypothetical protein